MAPELVAQVRPRSGAALRFRELCATLDTIGSDPLRTLVVTSAQNGEGKSIVAINLALAHAARANGDVLLIDADLRRPSVAGWLEPAPRLGLFELLSDQTELPHVLLGLRNSPLHVLPAGTVPADPLGALVTGRFEETMAELRRSFHRIVIDTPPVIPYTDADLLARFADGALIVARAGQTRKGELLQAIASMTGAPVVGTLLNDATRAETD
jgi:capsular exopolysaccharide synthesis family protein